MEAFDRRYECVTLLVRGVRRRQSELRGMLVPFVPVSASWYGPRELKTLRRVERIGGWPQPQGRALFSGLYVNESILKLTVREDPLPKLYDALVETMKTIYCETNYIAALRRSEWTLLIRLGFAPNLSHNGNGNEINGEETHWLMPKEAAVPLAEADRFHALSKGVAVSDATLIDLGEGSFVHRENLGQALKVTRLLTDNLLPEGIKSRQVLQ